MSIVLDADFISLLIEYEQTNLLEELDEDSRICYEHSSRRLIPSFIPDDPKFDNINTKLSNEIQNLNWNIEPKEFDRQKKIVQEFRKTNQIHPNEIIPLLKYYYREKNLNTYLNIRHLALNNDFSYRYYYYLILFYFTESTETKLTVVNEIKKSNIDIFNYPFIWLFHEIKEIVLNYYTDYRKLMFAFDKPSNFHPFMNVLMTKILQSYPDLDGGYCMAFYLVRKEYNFVKSFPKMTITLDDLYHAGKNCNLLPLS